MRFNSDQIRGILAAHGYTSNPDGLVEPFPWDYLETKDVAYLDIHADAVRNGDVVPDRPVRITFQKIEVGNGPGRRTLPLESKVRRRAGTGCRKQVP